MLRSPAPSAQWPALVLAAGLATRLHPLSAVRAKAAMPVAGQPIIGRILHWLRQAGIARVVINLHHRPETMTRVVGDGSLWDLDVRYSWEPTVLGSAGGPRRALDLLDHPRFLVVNGDTLTDCDLPALMARHLATRARVTMAVVRGDTARYGGVMVRDDGHVAGFARRAARDDASSGAPHAQSQVRHFIGVQAVDADVFARLPADRPAETVREVYPALLRQHPGAIVAFESGAEFFDVGTPGDYLDTVEAIATREGRAMDRGVGCTIHPTAALTRSVVWDHVTIGPDAQLTHCVLADGVVVPAGTTVTDSVLIAHPSGFSASPLTPTGVTQGCVGGQR